jgi:hypothetical protein
MTESLREKINMDWLNQLGGMLQQYTGTAAAPATLDVHDHFDQVVQVAPQSSLAEALAAAFGSSETPPAAQLVCQLFGQSNGQQQAGLLNTLIASAGPAVVSQLLANSGTSNLASLVREGQTELTPEQAAQVAPDTVQQIAEHAEKQDPSLMDKLGEFYSEHPTLVKSLGAVVLGVALSKIAKRQ